MVYFWALYSVPLIFISVLCQKMLLLTTVALSCGLKTGLILPAPFFLQDCFGFWVLFLYRLLGIFFYSSSVKKNY